MMAKQLLAVVAIVTSANAAALQVEMDDFICSNRALLAKATAEARDRGESLESWKLNLQQTKAVVDKSNPLWAAIAQGLYDADGVFGPGRKVRPLDTYKDYYRTCMEVRGHSNLVFRE